MLAKDFRDQINRGLGKAILFLKSNPPKPEKYLKAISYACTHNTAYDAQCEDSRAQYLWEIIQSSGFSEILQEQVLQSLLATDKPYDIEQMIQLALLFAENGNDQARKVIRKAFQFSKEWNQFIGAEEIVLLDGIEGLLFVTDAIGSKIISDKGSWETDELLEFACEHLGNDIVVSFFIEAGKSNSNVKAYIDSVETFKQERKDYSRNEPETFAQIKHVIDSEDVSHLHRFSIWGKHAPEDEFMKAAEGLLSESNKLKLIKYLRIFWRRPFPLAPEKIIDIAYSKNKKYTEEAIMVLRHIKHDFIHDLAIKLLNKTPRNYDALELLVNNYKENDYQLLEEIVFDKHNKDSFHSIGLETLNIFDENATKNCLSVLVQIYKLGWCSLCRERCVDIMIRNESVPDWVALESEYDSNLDIRQKIKEYKMHAT